MLRQELQPLHVQQQVLHSLAALLLRSPVAASNGASPGAAGGAGADQLPEGRAALLEELQDSLLPSLLIPERRLEVLVEQVGRPAAPAGPTAQPTARAGCAALRRAVSRAGGL